MTESRTTTRLLIQRSVGFVPSPHYFPNRRRRCGELQLLDAPSIRNPDPVIVSLKIHPVEERFLLAGSQDGRVSIYNVETSQQHLDPIARSTISHGRLRQADWFPLDSGAFVTVQTNSVSVWDTNTLTPVVQHSIPPNSVVALHPWDGKLLAVASEQGLQLLDVVNGALTHTLSGETGWGALVWSPACRHVLASDACLWDLRRPRSHLTTLSKDTEAVSIGYRPDGRQWKRTKSRSVAVARMAFVPSGHALVQVNSSGEIDCWDLRGYGHWMPKRFLGPGGRGKPALAVGGPLLVDDRIWIGRGSQLCSWSLDDAGPPQQVLRGHLSSIQDITQSRVTGNLFSSGKDGLVLTWGLPRI